jgi:signal recognition particle receptor subunit beta
MVIYNAATRELTAKIVYYGPGLCGKTTNLKVLHDRLEPGTAGKLLNLQTQTDRTIYFDLLPVELGDIKGYKIRFQLATVPGQTAFNETRRVVLKGVDGIVFVADSQWTMLPKNLESWQNLKDNLKSNEISFEKIPVVIQYNKRDLADILAIDAMQEALGLSSYPYVEAVASAGRGVTETFKLISKLTFVDLLRRLQGRKAEEEETAAAAAEEARQDDLQTWKDSLLKRESQANGQAQRPSRPFSLVPRVSDEAPFDTTELGREVDTDDEASPYAVPEPPGLEPGAPMELTPPSATIEIDAIGLDELEHSAEEPEILTEADEVEELTAAEEVEIEAFEPIAAEVPRQHAADPTFLPTGDEARAAGERLALLEERLREAESRAEREREASERIDQAVTSAHERVAATTEHLSALGSRLEALEKGVAVIHEAMGALAHRLVPVETASEGRVGLEASIQGLESALQAVSERIDTGAARQRKDADDLGMALGTLNEKALVVDQQMAVLLSQTGTHEDQMSELKQLADSIPRLEGQVAALLGLADRLPRLESQIEAAVRQQHELEATFDEKTQQGRREAEDIRSQIAPLLEERVRRHESESHLFAEMERLRESLSESLHDLAERLRSSVRNS